MAKRRTSAATADLFSTDTQVGFLLRRAYQKFNANLSSRIAGYGITPQQFGTLAKIGEVGRISQNQLGRLVSMDPAAIHGVIQRLLVRGLVTRARSTTDRRLYVLSLSPGGKKLVREVAPLARESQKISLESMREDETQVLLELLHRLVNEAPGAELPRPGPRR